MELIYDRYTTGGGEVTRDQSLAGKHRPIIRREKIATHTGHWIDIHVILSLDELVELAKVINENS